MRPVVTRGQAAWTVGGREPVDPADGVLVRMISGWTLLGLVLALVGLVIGPGERPDEPPWWVRTALWCAAVAAFVVAVLA